MDSYANFIEMLNDGEKRKGLEQLKAEHSKQDPVFKEIRQLSDTFQDALTSLFFDSTEPKLRELTRKYGLF